MKEAKQLLEKILHGQKTILAYYTGGVMCAGVESILFSTICFNKRNLLSDFVNPFIQIGAALTQSRVQDATAVKVKIEGIDFPLYFCTSNGTCFITNGINQSEAHEKIVTNEETTIPELTNNKINNILEQTERLSVKITICPY